jgi:transcriptional regulator with XRE-family HTH domain
MDVSENIKRAREKSDLSYSELSKLTGIAKSTLQRYETGTTVKIPLDAVEKIAEVLSISPAYLMGWTDDPINYDDPGLVADLSGPVLDYFDGNVKKALEFQKAVDSDALSEQLRLVGVNKYQGELPDDIIQLAIRINKLSPASRNTVVALVGNMEIVDAQLTKEPQKEA